MENQFPIVMALGGRNVVSQKLRDIGYERATTNAIRMWKQRRQISGNFVVPLMILADRQGLAYRAHDFMLQS